MKGIYILRFCRFDQMITLGNVSHANQTSWTDFITCHKPGRLKSIGLASGMNTHYFDIELDGNSILRPDGVADIRFHSSQQYGGGEGNNSLSFDCGFDKLHIEIKDGQAPSAEPRYWCIFEIDGANLSMSQSTFMKKWNSSEDSDDNLLTIEEEDFVYKHYQDDDGEDVISHTCGRPQAASIILPDTIELDEGSNIEGQLFTFDWRYNPIEPDDDLFPLHLHLAQHNESVTTIEPDFIETEEIGTGLRFEIPSDFAQPFTSWSISTSATKWANFRAPFTLL